jgi:HSP20 family protein
MASGPEKFLDRLRMLERQLDKLATEFFFSESFLDAPRGGLWQPPTDVYETDTEVVVRIEAPGLDVSDIRIVLQSNALLVRAVRRDPSLDEKRTYHQLEIRYGLFERVVQLPRNIRHEEAEATYTSGFLVVTVPKCPEAREATAVVHLRL